MARLSKREDEIARLVAEKSTLEGRVSQMLTDLDATRNEVIIERQAAERARTELAQRGAVLEVHVALTGARPGRVGQGAESDEKITRKKPPPRKERRKFSGRCTTR